MKIRLLYELPEGFKDWDDWRARGRKMDARSGKVLNRPKVIGVDVLDLGATPRQHFTPEYVMQAVRDGWMKVDSGRIVITGVNMTVEYKVKREPGYYCCHCGAPMDDGRSAREHIDAEHSGKASPDDSNPSGYERINYFDCEEANPRASGKD